jgi:hypothetical protein
VPSPAVVKVKIGREFLAGLCPLHITALLIGDRVAPFQIPRGLLDKKIPSSLRVNWGDLGKMIFFCQGNPFLSVPYVVVIISLRTSMLPN